MELNYLNMRKSGIKPGRLSEFKFNTSRFKWFKLTSARIFALGFLVLIFIGAIILYLPISTVGPVPIGFTDALFTSASAVCVTGLVVVDTGLQWSVFGKSLILFLIQIGALGIMSVVTLFWLVTGKKLGLKQKLTIQESIQNFSLQGIKTVFIRILIITLMLEVAGAAIISFRLIPRYGFQDGVLKSIFHSVSSFCNAGFDIFGTKSNPYISLQDFKEDSLMLITTALLIIIGGLGFVVWNDIASGRRFSQYTLHSKVVIVTSSVLLVFGTFGFLLFEHGNPETLGNLSGGTKLLNAFFQSVTTRTAGFSTIKTEAMRDVSGLFAILLMIVGGAPGSTAGGIKVTTLSVIILSLITFLLGRRDVQAFGRRVPEETIKKTFIIIILTFFLIVSVTMILLVENDFVFLPTLFEVISAFGTVGLSMGITEELSALSKLLLIATMIIGRIGPFGAIIAFTFIQEKKPATYRYPEGKITVG